MSLRVVYVAPYFVNDLSTSFDDCKIRLTRSILEKPRKTYEKPRFLHGFSEFLNLYES